VIVLDNSALAEAVIGRRPPNELLNDLAGGDVHAPHLIDYEFRVALRGLVLGGKISRARAEGAILVKGSLTFHRHPESATGPRARDLRDDLNPYDASYVAPAEQLQRPLATTDAELERHVRTVVVKLYR
jgi:predicted nucleic acid-binding protein